MMLVQLAVLLELLVLLLLDGGVEVSGGGVVGLTDG